MEPAYEPVMVQNQNVEVQQAAQQVAPQSVGSALDQGVKTKMGEVQTQFENALLKTLDKIKITVDDGSMAPVQQQSQAVSTTIVQDSVVNAQGAPEAYMSLENAPEIDEEYANESLAKAKDEEEEETIGNRLRLSPVIGMSTINSDIYNIDSKYTAGISLEIDVSDNLAAVLGYSYSQYDISLGGSNPLLGFYNPGFYQGNLNTLRYNQNVFDAGLRFYLLPRTSKFNVFAGGGLGYNKGYLNYKTGVFNTYAQNPYSNAADYEVTSFLGIMEAGAEVSLAKNVSVGGLFKYANVLSSEENQPLNNYGFIGNGYGNNISNDQRVVGGSIAENSFYSILGTIKVSF